MRAALAGDIRTIFMQALAFLDASRDGESGRGCSHADPAILQSQGDASSALAIMMKHAIVSELGLLERIDQPGACFLDVGTGVASLAIAMCRAFPQLRVIGLDISEAALALARTNVTKAGPSDRSPPMRRASNATP
jgi:predicted O-methyltransferase YrrM